MKSAMKYGIFAAAMLVLTAPAFALNPQPEPPGVTHDPNMSIQYSSRTLTGPATNSCAVASTAPAPVVAGATQVAGGMNARNNSAGGAINTGVMANVDKCHTTAANSMGAATPATPPTH